MPQPKQPSADGCGTILVCLAIGFGMGRCTTPPPPPAPPAITAAPTPIEPALDQPAADPPAQADADAAPPAGTSAPDQAGVDQSEDQPVHFENCTAAREAGAAPIYEGQPGYAPHLDRDHDGIACE